MIYFAQTLKQHQYQPNQKQINCATKYLLTKPTQHPMKTKKIQLDMSYTYHPQIEKQIQEIIQFVSFIDSGYQQFVYFSENVEGIAKNKAIQLLSVLSDRIIMLVLPSCFKSVALSFICKKFKQLRHLCFGYDSCAHMQTMYINIAMNNSNTYFIPYTIHESEQLPKINSIKSMNIPIETKTHKIIKKIEDIQSLSLGLINKKIFMEKQLLSYFVNDIKSLIQLTIVGVRNCGDIVPVIYNNPLLVSVSLRFCENVNSAFINAVSISCTHLRRLCIEGGTNIFYGVQLQKLSRVQTLILRQQKQIRSNIKNNFPVYGIKKLTNVTYLDLCNKGIVSWINMQMMENLGELANLTVLNISFNNISDKEIICLQKLDKLKIFICVCNASISGKVLAETLRQCKQLKMLNVAGLPLIQDQNMLTINKNSSKIIYLNISQCSRISHESIKQYKKLCWLVCRNTAVNIQKVIQANKNLIVNNNLINKKIIGAKISQRLSDDQIIEQPSIPIKRSKQGHSRSKIRKNSSNLRQ